MDRLGVDTRKRGEGDTGNSEGIKKAWSDLIIMV